MTRSSLRLLLIASLAAPVALATPGLAQNQAAAPAPGAHAQDGAHHWRDPAARAAEHAQRLREALQLRPDQESALGAFLQATAHPAHDWRQKDGQGPAEKQALTTPERLDRMAAFLDKRRVAFTARADATKRFYGQLTPSQQKAFDVMGGGRFGRGGGFGHGGGGFGRGDFHHGPGGPGHAGQGDAGTGA